MSFSMDGYIDVAERIREFRRQHPNGSLRPYNPDKPFEVVTLATDDGRTKTFIVYVAAAYRTPDDACAGIGVAWEPFEGKTPYTRDSELMNAETSAWGRAIVAALAADTQKVASLQEVRNRQTTPAGDAPVVPIGQAPRNSTPPANRSREQMIAAADAKGAAVKPAANGDGITPAQIKLLSKLARERGADPAAYCGDVLGRAVDAVESISKREAMRVITQLTETRGA
jgi:hypothetical protein